MNSFGRVFRKVFIGFMALYLVIMGSFTVSKQLDIRREYNNQAIAAFIDLKDMLTATYSLESVKQELAKNPKDEILQQIAKETQLKLEEVEECANTLGGSMHINDWLTHNSAYTDEFRAYQAVKVFRNNKEIAGNGLYLICNAIDWNLSPLKGGNKYIDLERCFTSEERLSFISLIREIKNNPLKLDWVKASGYTKGSEVYPKKIEVYEIKKDKAEDNWSEKEAVLIQTYEFEVGKSLEGYESDWWQLSIPFSEELKWSKKQEQVFHEVNEQCQAWYEEKMIKKDKSVWEDNKPFNWEKGLFKVGYSVCNTVETETGDYQIAYSASYKPWQIAFSKLKLVYLFSMITMVVTAFILSSALWKTEQKRKLLEEKRKQLISAIGHELKTPLGIIQAYSEGLKENVAENKRAHYLEVIIDETQRMDQLILQMLKLSKLESKAYSLKLERFKINDLIHQALKNKEKLFEDKEMELQVNLASFLEVIGDYECLLQVMNNFILNGIEHTPIGGKMVIGILGKQVFVFNEGAGIPKEKQVEIWSAFRKVEDDHERNGRGTGLGLCICKQIFELHGLSYGVENEADGVKFWFEFN